MKAPQRGDVVHLQFDPASGTEMKGPHFGLVVSPAAFNARFQKAWICPISQGAADAARDASFLVTLMGTGCKTVGNIHTHQLKCLDYAVRKARRIETVPAVVIAEVLDRLRTVLDD
ncbi:MAG: type II toxin-antitoxin system PemK/MazF family toxin [Nevskia sp.]|nr:type II toxin-antitoxin system PemK/MazF family toxin [Nevskia sp.]